MRKSVLVGIFISFLIIPLIGCSQEEGHVLTPEEKANMPQYIMGEETSSTSEAGETPEENTEVIETPIWTTEDLKGVTEMLKTADIAEVYPTNPNIIPPFYKEKEPFHYLSHKYPKEASLGYYIDICYEFKGFVNIFFYDSDSGFIPKGAQTVNMNSTRLIAEARLLTDSVNANGQFQIEEIHYDSDNNISFMCTSTFDSRGYKIKESDTRGQKERDYYFIWPADSY